MGSIQDPQYGLIAWELSGAVMFVCVAELVYRGSVKEKMSFLQCLKSLVPSSSEKKPYSFIDGVILGFAKVQMALAAISYCYLRQGKENPISVSLVALIFISCFVFYRLLRNRFSKGSPVLPVRQEN
ncbi:hypothetical protein M5689_020083 [Euphorbia peplus]|nr:hypothetical protein M5689_020083 [Euphorbia peplus]